jgi:hypothetical protein
VLNNPLAVTDPYGLYTVDQNGNVLGSYDGEVLCDDAGNCYVWSSGAGIWSPDQTQAPSNQDSPGTLSDGDVPIYGLFGQGAQVLAVAGRQASHDLSCVGLGAAVAGGSIAASAGTIAKPFSQGGTLGTSIASTVLRGVRIGTRIPTPIGTPGTSSFYRGATADLGGVAARYLPYVGTAVGAAAAYARLSSN